MYQAELNTQDRNVNPLGVETHCFFSTRSTGSGNRNRPGALISAPMIGEQNEV